MASEKTCFKCHTLKPLDDFYKHGQMGDGHLNKCKECTRKDVIANRLARIEHYRAFDKMRASQPHRVAARYVYARTEAGKLAHARASKKYSVSNVVRHIAHYAVSNAIRDGRLERWPCIICGDKAEGHHADYSNALGVTWLCKKHHTETHELAKELVNE